MTCATSYDSHQPGHPLSVISLYADDTVIMSESPNGLQSALNVYNDYCKQWKLTVNITKSKVVIFSKGRQANYSFVLNDQNLDLTGSAVITHVTLYRYKVRAPI